MNSRRGRLYRFCSPVLLACAFAVLAPVLPARAASLSVCNASNLVEAILAAQISGEVITIECDGTINLSAPIEITGTVALDATGSEVTLNGNGGRIFRVAPGAVLGLTNLTLLGGRADNGGAIFNRGELNLSDCLLTNNIASGPSGNDGRDGQDNDQNGGDGHDGSNGKRTAGGAIYNMGILRIVGSVFRGNSALGGSGGFGGNGGSAELVGGDGGEGGNGGAASGGAIFNAGQLYAFDSTFQQNRAQGGDAGIGGEPGEGAFVGQVGDGGRGGVGAGGAIFSTNKATVVLDRCTVAFNAVYSGHSADGGSSRNAGRSAESGPNAFGGGLASHGVSAVVNSTFYGNTIEAGNGGNGGTGEVRGGKGGSGGFAWGGNIYNAGTAGLTNCTLAGGLVRGGTNGFGGEGIFEGDDGKRGRGRGANAGNGKGRFMLMNTILATSASITNVQVVTNITWITNIISDVEGRTNALETICTREISIRAGVTNDSVDCIERNITGTNLVAGTTVRGTTNVVTSNIVEDRSNGYGSFKDLGYNLISDRSIKVKKGSTSKTGVDPKLGNLGDYDGPTETIPLLSGSPAIDAVPATFELCLEIDQRGIERPQGEKCDIGAFESDREIALPSITTQPADIVVGAGSNATFTVVASGDSLTYQWYRSPNVIIPGATNADYMIVGAIEASEGGYYVVVSNEFGSVTSRTAMLTVNSLAPTIVTNPASRVAGTGETVTFQVVASGAPAPSYLWYFNGTTLISGANTATLQLTNVQPANAGSYQVVVTNSAGSVTSLVATLTVNNTAPTIVSNLVNQTATFGDNVTFAVVANGAPPPTFRWFFNGTNLIAGVTTSNLLLTSVQATNAGTYHVVVTNTAGSVTSVVATLTVSAEAPAIVTNPTNQVAFSGETVNFNVAATGGAVFRWFFNQTNLISGASTSTLTLTNVQSSSAGPYHVVVSNAVGSVTSTPATLSVTNAGPVVIAGPMATNVVLGGTLTLTANVRGSLPLSYQWYFSASGNAGPVTNATSPTLTIPNFQPANEGFYSLEVTNPFDTILTDAVEVLRQ